jgi:hypothetical protein
MKIQINLLLFFGIFLIFSRQENLTTKQYYEECAEIDLAKKLIEAYLDQDWETYRSCYSDTARIWQNAWHTSDPGITPEEEIKATKDFVSKLASYTYEETIWEMIVNNAGDKWVHLWGKWVGKLTPNSDELVVPVHIAFGVIGDKIVYESGFWDNLPMHLVQQELEKEE